MPDFCLNTENWGKKHLGASFEIVTKTSHIFFFLSFLFGYKKKKTQNYISQNKV